MTVFFSKVFVCLGASLFIWTSLSWICLCLNTLVEGGRINSIVTSKGFGLYQGRGKVNRKAYSHLPNMQKRDQKIVEINNILRKQEKINSAITIEGKKDSEKVNRMKDSKIERNERGIIQLGRITSTKRRRRKLLEKILNSTANVINLEENRSLHASANAMEVSSLPLSDTERSVTISSLLELRGGSTMEAESFFGKLLRLWRNTKRPGIKQTFSDRLRRFARALFGISEKSTSSQRMKKTTKHLEKKYKAGNANFRIQKELRDVLKNPSENISVTVGDNIRVWIITITGAKGTIYAGEKYKLKVTFPNEYPTKPPSCYFLQPTPRHEHCYTNGDICLSLLGADWRPTMTASSLALAILSMLSSAKEKKLPLDNAQNADRQAGQVQDNWLYHDEKC